jgi:acetyl esterase
MLDMQLRRLLDQMQAACMPDMTSLPPTVARHLYTQMVTAGDVRPAGARIETRQMPGPGGPLDLRIYRPDGDTPARGVVLYLHGGGFVAGSAQDYDGVCSALCAQSGCMLVQVDYRLAPEHPFPAAVDDAYAALCWVAGHAAELGADARQLIVAGDSAGGNLAAVTALLARDRHGPKIAQQTLIYPAVAPLPEVFETYRRSGDNYTWSTCQDLYFGATYLGGQEPAADFRAAPLLAESHAGLPPALVMVAGYDPLHDEGIAYADKLMAAGTPASLVDYPTLAHGFITMSGVLDAARLAVSQVADAFRAAAGG